MNDAGVLHDAAVAVNPDIMVLCHGGPIAEPEDVRYVFEHTHGIAGFFGASSIERLATESGPTALRGAADRTAGDAELLAGARETGAYFYNFITGTWESIGNLPVFTVSAMTGGEMGEVYAGAPGEGIYIIYDSDFDGIPDIAHEACRAGSLPLSWRAVSQSLVSSL